MLTQSQIIIYVIPETLAVRLGEAVVSSQNVVNIVPVGGNDRYNIIYTDVVLSQLNTKILCRAIYEAIIKSPFYANTNTTSLQIIQHDDVSVSLNSYYTGIGVYMAQCAKLDPKFVYHAYQVKTTRPVVQKVPSTPTPPQVRRSIYDDPAYDEYKSERNILVEDDDDEDYNPYTDDDGEEDDDDEGGYLDLSELDWDDDDDGPNEYLQGQPWGYSKESKRSPVDSAFSSFMAGEYTSHSSNNNYGEYDDDEDDDDYEGYDGEESKVFSNAKRKRSCVEAHGIIVSEDKDDRKEDYEIIMEFLTTFIPGDKKWIEEYREAIANRWMAGYCISLKQYRKRCKDYERDMEKKSRNSERLRYNAIRNMQDMFKAIPADPWYDKDR